MNYVQFDGHGGRTEKEYASQQMVLTKQEEPRGVFSGMTLSEIYRGLEVSLPKQIAPMTFISSGTGYCEHHADRTIALPAPGFPAETVQKMVEVKNWRIAELEAKLQAALGTIDSLEARLRAPTAPAKPSMGDILSRSTDRLLDSYGR